MADRVERRACDDGHARIEYEVRIPVQNGYTVDANVPIDEAESRACPLCLSRQRLDTADTELANLRFRMDQVEQEFRQHVLWHKHAAPAIDPIIDEYYQAEDAREVLQKPVAARPDDEEDIPF